MIVALEVMLDGGCRGGLLDEREDVTYFHLLGVQADLTSNLAGRYRRIKSSKSRIVVHLSNHRGVG
jgi:hypothetical protein